METSRQKQGSLLAPVMVMLVAAVAGGGCGSAGAGDAGGWLVMVAVVMVTHGASSGGDVCLSLVL